MSEAAPANLFCFVSEEEYAEDQFRQDLLERWRDEGARQMRVTIVNEQYPHEPYPHGVWIEGWLDSEAQMLPFGEAYPADGPVWPGLVESDVGSEQ